MYIVAPQEDTPIHEWRQVPCPQCKDLIELSGLKPHERGRSLADIRGEGIHTTLRVAGAIILKNKMGFCTVWGNTGSAKSLWAQALTVAFCKAGVRSYYCHGKDIERSLFHKDDDGKNYTDGTRRDHLCNMRVLIVDELDAMNWRNEWIAGEMQDFFDARYRMADNPDPHQRLITIMVAQTDPALWAPDFLYSRMRDTFYSIPWPENVSSETDGVINGRVYWPLKVQADDERQFTPSGMRPALVHPHTGEILEEEPF